MMVIHIIVESLIVCVSSKFVNMTLLLVFLPLMFPNTLKVVHSIQLFIEYWTFPVLLCVTEMLGIKWSTFTD